MPIRPSLSKLCRLWWNIFWDFFAFVFTLTPPLSCRQASRTLCPRWPTPRPSTSGPASVSSLSSAPSSSTPLSTMLPGGQILIHAKWLKSYVLYFILKKSSKNKSEVDLQVTMERLFERSRIMMFWWGLFAKSGIITTATPPDVAKYSQMWILSNLLKFYSVKSFLILSLKSSILLSIFV